MWTMGWMMFGMVLFWGLLIFAAVWLVKLLFQSGKSQSDRSQGQLTPTEILEIRYARGEITREQYDQMRKDLQE
jgi:putative membrane protein